MKLKAKYKTGQVLLIDYECNCQSVGRLMRLQRQSEKENFPIGVYAKTSEKRREFVVLVTCLDLSVKGLRDVNPVLEAIKWRN